MLLLPPLLARAAGRNGPADGRGARRWGRGRSVVVRPVPPADPAGRFSQGLWLRSGSVRLTYDGGMNASTLSIGAVAKGEAPRGVAIRRDRGVLRAVEEGGGHCCAGPSGPYAARPEGGAFRRSEPENHRTNRFIDAGLENNQDRVTLISSRVLARHPKCQTGSVTSGWPTATASRPCRPSGRIVPSPSRVRPRERTATSTNSILQWLAQPKPWQVT